MSIKETRETLGLTISQVSKLSGIPYRTLKHWDDGDRECPAWTERLVKKEIERISEIAREVKYLVIDNRTTEEFVVVKNSLEEANTEAESQWDCLTQKEQALRHIYVLDVTIEDLADYAIDEDGNIDWSAYEQGGHCEGRFDTNINPSFIEQSGLITMGFGEQHVVIKTDGLCFDEDDDKDEAIREWIEADFDYVENELGRSLWSHEKKYLNEKLELHYEFKPSI